MNGKAYIIGTGPGDEELLTVKAVKILKKCTAVLYDRLVSNNILNYLNEDCLVYYCGKEPGAHYKTQEEINDMLVRLVKEGHIVGRVKGGDPYVFGRGGEEVLSLVEENLDINLIYVCGKNESLQRKAEKFVKKKIKLFKLCLEIKKTP